MVPCFKNHLQAGWPMDSPFICEASQWEGCLHKTTSTFSVLAALNSLISCQYMHTWSCWHQKNLENTGSPRWLELWFRALLWHLLNTFESNFWTYIFLSYITWHAVKPWSGGWGSQKGGGRAEASRKRGQRRWGIETNTECQLRKVAFVRVFLTYVHCTE